jgi:hypothetical protein
LSTNFLSLCFREKLSFPICSAASEVLYNPFIGLILSARRGTGESGEVEKKWKFIVEIEVEILLLRKYRRTD